MLINIFIMPEGVEVLIQTNILKKTYKGKNIIGIHKTKSFQRNGIKNTGIVNLPLKIVDVWSRGKIIVFELLNKTKTKTLYMTSHLGMSGQWVSEKGNHTNLWFDLGYEHPEHPGHYYKTRTMYYNDQRHFGTIEFHTDLTCIWKRHGPCMMLTSLIRFNHINKTNLNKDQKTVTYDSYKTKIRNKRFKANKRIAEYLMDQSRVSGVGNYLRAEILYRSKISPLRTLKSLSDDDIKTLYNTTLLIMNESYSQKGKYHQGTKCGDGFQLRVYKQETDPNGYPIQTFHDQNKRMCYYVVEIQK